MQKHSVVVVVYHYHCHFDFDFQIFLYKSNVYIDNLESDQLIDWIKFLSKNFDSNRTFFPFSKQKTKKKFQVIEFMNRNFQFEILFIIANAPTFFIGLLNVCGGGSRSGIIKIIRNKHSILISRPNKQTLQLLFASISPNFITWFD